MGIAERKQREKEERRELIMRCAKELILQHGADDVRIQDIARQAELSKATVYLYFPSKDALFQEICDSISLGFIRYFTENCPRGLSAIGSLKFWWECYLKTFGVTEDIMVIFNMRKYLTPNMSFAQLNNSSDTSNAPSYAFYSALKALIEQGIREGDFLDSIDSDTLARTLISLFSHIVEDTASMPAGRQKSALVIEKTVTLFLLFLRGIVTDRVDRSSLALPGSILPPGA
jgi:AcrR family transcriptional regulator